MKKFETMQARAVALPIANIDTDQIIPARFLKTISRNGLGQHLFSDWRYDNDGQPKPEFVLNQPEAAGAEILLAGDHFGCGSSREHAPWALADFGFRAIVSSRFADIFRNNALKNGLLPVEIDADTLRQLFSLLDEDPAMELVIDLEQQQLVLPDGRRLEFPIDEFSKTCMLEGVDQLGYLLQQDEPMAAYEQANPVRVNTAARPV